MGAIYASAFSPVGNAFISDTQQAAGVAVVHDQESFSLVSTDDLNDRIQSHFRGMSSFSSLKRCLSGQGFERKTETGPSGEVVVHFSKKKIGPFSSIHAANMAVVSSAMKAPHLL